MGRSNNILESNLEGYYQAKLATPIAVLGIRTNGVWLTDIEYLPPDTPPLVFQNELTKEVCRQLQAYLSDPNFVFDL